MAIARPLVRDMLTSGRRLEFEGEALAQIYAPVISRPRRRARRHTLSAFLFIALIAVGGILGAGTLVQSGFFGSDRRAITQTVDTLLTGIATQDLALALSVCAESDEGARKLMETEKEAFRVPAVTSDSLAALMQRRESISSVRAELEAAGVNWNDVRPVAFGGIRGRVLDGNAMRKPITVVAGALYFVSGNRTFALEMSAWRCDGSYVVTELWQGEAVDEGPGDLKALSEAEFDAFSKEPPDNDAPLDIEYPKHLFFYL